MKRALVAAALLTACGGRCPALEAEGLPACGAVIEGAADAGLEVVSLSKRRDVECPNVLTVRFAEGEGEICCEP
ncbi:MAG TPA: hypothetical protein VF989_20625 [Polyangiaceae bacterium]